MVPTPLSDLAAALHHGCETGDIEPIIQIFKPHGKLPKEMLSLIDSRIVDDEYPLIVAAKNGMVEMIKLLLEKDAEVDVGSGERDGMTALMMACDKNQYEVAELLMDYGANIESLFMSGATALYICVHLGHEDLTELLLKRGANSNARDKQGFSCLHISCRKGLVKISQLLLENGATLLSRMTDGRTPWDLAFQNRQEPILHLLIKNGFNINDNNLLNVACKKRDLWAISWLLKNGADIEARNETVRPLVVAAKNGFWEVIVKLIENGANVNVEDELGFSPLWHTCMAEFHEVAISLLSNGANPNTRPSEHVKTPLQLVASKGRTEFQYSLRLELADSLIINGADLNATYYHSKRTGIQDKLTAIHIAITTKFVPMVKLLVKRGALYPPLVVVKEEGGREVIMERKTVWELASQDNEMNESLSLPWSVESHNRQPPCVISSIKCVLLMNKRMHWQLDPPVMHKIFGYISDRWYDYWHY